MKAEELSDQLVLSTKEQDVASLLYTLAKMKEEDCLEQAINNKHSQNGYSALTSILTHSPFSQIDKLILELLLLSGAHYGWEEIAMVASETGNEAVDILLDWEKSKRDEAIDARHLLSLDFQQAATWIEEHLLPSNVSLPSSPSPSSNKTAPAPQSPSTKCLPADKVSPSSNGLARATLRTRSNSPILAEVRISAACTNQLPLPPHPNGSKRQRRRARFSRRARESQPDCVITTKIPSSSSGLVRILLQGLPSSCTRTYVADLLLRYISSWTVLKVYCLRGSSYALFNVRIAQAHQLVGDLNRHKGGRFACKTLPEGKGLKEPPSPELTLRKVNLGHSFGPVQTCSRYNLRIRLPPQSEAQTQVDSPSSDEGGPPLLTESNLSKLQLNFSPRPRPLSVEVDDHSFVTCNFGSSEAPVLRSGTPSILGRLLSSPAMSIDEDLAMQAILSPCRSPPLPQSYSTDAAANRDHGEGNLEENLNQEEMKVDDELGFG